MNTSSLNSHLVFVRVAMPASVVLAANPLAYSLDSVAGNLLWQLLGSELSRAQILLEVAGSLPSLGRGVGIFEVSDVGAAARVILSSLDRNRLTPHATLYRFDKEEQVLRSFFPRSGEDILLDAVEEQIAAQQMVTNQMLEVFRAYLQRPGQGTGENPGS